MNKFLKIFNFCFKFLFIIFVVFFSLSVLMQRFSNNNVSLFGAYDISLLPDNVKNISDTTKVENCNLLSPLLVLCVQNNQTLTLRLEYHFHLPMNARTYIFPYCSIPHYSKNECSICSFQKKLSQYDHQALLNQLQESNKQLLPCRRM